MVRKNYGGMYGTQRGHFQFKLSLSSAIESLVPVPTVLLIVKNELCTYGSYAVLDCTSPTSDWSVVIVAYFFTANFYILLDWKDAFKFTLRR